MARPNILDRFRPLGTPGPAGPAGVAAVDDEGVASELAPVFAALDADVRRCRALVEAARREADEELSRARRDAAALVAQARLSAGAERARAAAAVARAAAGDDARLLERARTLAVELDATGSARLPTTVRTVIDALVADALAPS